MSKRDKLILAGLFLSRFNGNALKALGFTTFSEAFNVLAFSVKAKPASIKNYRDEFDPYFPNSRKGWHKRPMRAYCRSLMDQYREMSLSDFVDVIKFQFSDGGELALMDQQLEEPECGTFAKRLITGQAAEKYFEGVYKAVQPFRDCELVNTTALGCGFDYRMLTTTNSFFAVEVKGMASRVGAVQLTSKEHDVAEFLGCRFFLFVVRNFSEKPFHTLFQDPVNSDLVFQRREKVTVQISWTASIGS